MTQNSREKMRDDQTDPAEAPAPRRRQPTDDNPETSYKYNVKTARREAVVTKKPRRLGGSRFSGIIGVIQIVTGAVLTAWLINHFVFQSFEVDGSSMQNTLEHGDRLIINKFGKTTASLFGNDYLPKRGQIVVFNSPKNNTRQLVKRVIGLPGDTVTIDNGVITVTNDENPEGFNPDLTYEEQLTVDQATNNEVVVDEGTVFVAGDNRAGGASLDSRNNLGLVPVDNLIGDLVIRILPISEAEFY